MSTAQSITSLWNRLSAFGQGEVYLMEATKDHRPDTAAGGSQRE